jgi:hypothetical protein
VSVREDVLLACAREFFAARIFGPDRKALLAEQLPAGAAEDVQALYSKAHNQVTLLATITPSTSAALAAIIAASETPDLTALLSTLTGQDHVSDLACHPGAAAMP